MKLSIIGAGPRGLGVLERLIANWSYPVKESLEIDLYDATGIAGSVWRNNQSELLLMNSIAQQVTLFPDESVQMEGKSNLGPTLYEWSQQYARVFIQQQNYPNESGLLNEVSRLTANDHSTRILYGVYQQWFYSKLQQQLPIGVTCRFVKDDVLTVKQEAHSWQVTAKKNETMHYDVIILTTGHARQNQSVEQQQLADYAYRHHLFYQEPSNAADVDTTRIPAKETVILRGLGLAFFDYLALFSIGRGGEFQEVEGQLVYLPSGEEPRLIAGSRTGIPHYPRAKNQKENGQQTKPLFLTERRLKTWAAAGEKKGRRFFELLFLEAEYRYYTTLISEKRLPIDVHAFSALFTEHENDKEQVLKQFAIPSNLWWSLEALAHPLSEEESYSREIMIVLNKMIEEAQKGNCMGAIAAAIDTLKDMREPIRFMLEHGLFSKKEEAELLWHWFTPLNAALTIGPPLERTRQLLALLNAGIVELIPPGMEVIGEHQHFCASSKNVNQHWTSKYLIEARIPGTAIQSTQNQPLQQLYQAGIIREYQLHNMDGSLRLATGGVEVNRHTHQVVTHDSVLVPNLYCFGIPVEGCDWLTAAAARPQDNAWNFRQADQLVQTILKEAVNKIIE